MINLGNVLLFALTFCVSVIFFSYLNEVIVQLPEGKVSLVKPVWPLAKKQSARGIVISLMGGIFAIVITLYYGFTLAALTVFLLYGVLTVISFIDWDTMEIPPVLNIMILVLGIISIFTMGGPSILERVIGLFCISLPLYLIILVIPEGFGGGDIKMMFAAGFFLGWKGTLVAFCIGAILGGIYGVYMLAVRKSGGKEHFAFGPFLALGIAIAAYANLGDNLLNAYIDTLKMSMNTY